MDPALREQVLASHVFGEMGTALPVIEEPVAVSALGARSPKVRVGIPIPLAPYLERKTRLLPNLAEIWTYINPHMLYGRHLGFKGKAGLSFERALADRDPKALELFHHVEDIKRDALTWMKARAVWQFFEMERDGNDLHLFAPGGASPIETFHFGRQAKSDGLCLSDYALGPQDGQRDHLALFVVSAGEGVMAHSRAAKERGEFLNAHAIQALGIETAEAAAEYLHRRLREEWGFPDAPTMTMQERFTSRYRGKRYSFGYPACPNLEDQSKLFRLLQPEEIGVQLTEGFMMEPEASVSALVLHHPDCVYFTAAEETEPAFA
jgi:5-methyltetrahydrofolate--homocysteine methyltransferase